MARKNQKLINYHTGKKTEMPSGSSVDFGEIVVRHNEEAPELLIKVGTDSFAVFQASGAVQTAINTAVSAAQSTLNTTISGLQSDVKSLSSATKTLIDEVSAATKDTYATKADLEATSGSIITAYTTAIGSLANDLNELSGVVSSITENYVTNSTLNTKVSELEGKISSARTEAIGKASGYTDTQIAAAKEYSDGKLSAATETLNQSITTLSGNVHTRIEGLESGLTKTINEKVATAYRYKGSCTYEQLTGKTAEFTGEVWNVTDANGDFPAGTNYAWDGEKWDALGGSIDLSPYATSANVKTEIDGIKQTTGDLKSAIDSVSSATKTLVSDVSAATKATYATKAELKSTSGSIISDYTTAIATAKSEAVSSGKGYTDGQISAVTSAYTQADKDLDARIDKLEAISADTQSAVQNVVVYNTNANKITAIKTNESNVVTLNFDNMVIDCGDF